MRRAFHRHLACKAISFEGTILKQKSAKAILPLAFLACPVVSCYECSRVHTFGGFQTYQWILAVAAALCLGMSKTGFVGLNLLGIALMASVWPARESTGVILPMLVFGDFFGVATFHRHALWPEIWRVLPPALAGVVIGFGIFHVLPAPLFAPLIGWTIFVLLALQILQRRGAAARLLVRLSG